MGPIRAHDVFEIRGGIGMRGGLGVRGERRLWLTDAIDLFGLWRGLSVCRGRGVERGLWCPGGLLVVV